jgi:hypothetical protein
MQTTEPHVLRLLQEKSKVTTSPLFNLKPAWITSQDSSLDVTCMKYSGVPNTFHWSRVLTLHRTRVGQAGTPRVQVAAQRPAILTRLP